MNEHILKFSQGHNSINKKVELRYMFCAHRVIMLIFEPSFVKVSQRVSELQTLTIGFVIKRLVIT